MMVFPVQNNMLHIYFVCNFIDSQLCLFLYVHEMFNIFSRQNIRDLSELIRQIRDDFSWKKSETCQKSLSSEEITTLKSNHKSHKCVNLCRNVGYFHVLFVYFR